MSETFEISFEEFVAVETENSKITNEVFKREFEIFKDFFDIQLKLFKNHFGGYIDPYYGMEEYERIVVQSFLKANHLLFIVVELNKKGNYGAANILLRQIFEFLVLGKYVNLIKDEEMALRWLNQRQFDVYDKVIRLLEKPSKKNFHDFWIIICSLAHATTSSHQIILKANSNVSHIRQSLVIGLLLQRCNYHLLSVCLINRKLIYRSEFYGGLKSENSELKQAARKLKREIYALFSSDGIELLKDFESKWVLKK